MCVCVCVLPGISVSAVPSSTVLAAGQCVYGQHVEGVSSTHEKCVLQMRLQLLGVGIARNLCCYHVSYNQLTKLSTRFRLMIPCTC